MSYIGSFAIDDLLTFYCQTQVFSTGVATDADAVPAYRIYEDETTTPLLTGNMALLDSANTAGFYSEQVTLSAANGFEKGKCYSIQIAATVSSVAGATIRTFQIGAAVDAKHLGGTVQTGRDVGASVLLSSGTGTGQVKLSSGYVAPNWGDVGNPTTTLALTGTTIATTQKVDVETIKANPVVNAGTITFPAGATLASTTNITGGTITTVTTLTNLPAIPAGWLTATGIASDAITAAKIADNAIDTATFAAGTTIPRCTLVDTLTTYTGNTPQTGDVYPKVDTEVAAIKAKTDFLPSATAGAAGGLFIAGTNAATDIVSLNLALFAVEGPGWINAGSIADDTIDADSIKADAVTKIQAGLSTYAGGDTSGTTTLLSRLTNTRAGLLDNLDDAITSRQATFTGTITTFDGLVTALATAHGAGSWVTATGFSTLTAADVRTAIGMASANLDTQLSTLGTAANLSTANAALVKLLAASYNSATVSGSVITLSNGATQTVTASGRVTA